MFTENISMELVYTLIPYKSHFETYNPMSLFFRKRVDLQLNEAFLPFFELLLIQPLDTSADDRREFSLLVCP